MFELSVKEHFSAAHSIEGYCGACANLHGHNYTVEAIVQCKGLNEIGMGIDFKTLREHLKSILESLDHRNLNEHAAFKKGDRANNPTSENLARYIYSKLEVLLRKDKVRLGRITIFETEKAAASYWPDRKK